MAKPPRRAAGRSKTARARTTSSARKPAGRTAGKGARKATTAKGAGKGARKKADARKPASARSRKTTSPAKNPKSPRTRAVTRRTPAASAQRKTAPPAPRPAKKPAVRRVLPDDLVPTPPSTLNRDRSASAARSGRRGLARQLHVHTETGPSFTGGDVDANWEVAYSSGDEAPGGDNPTPDQDVVEEIGRAIGVEYADNEELRAADKVADRDRHRWELDPASADDYQERTRKK